MSLASLTFGNKNSATGYHKPSKHATEFANITIPKGQEQSSLEIRKVCSFYNLSELYLVCKVISGFISQDMKIKVNDQLFDITELEANKPIGSQGMAVGLLVKGLSQDAVSKGEIIEAMKV